MDDHTMSLLRTRKDDRLGFTVIEILVTITIVSLFIGVTFASFSQFSKRQSLVAAGQTMKNILRDGQSRAFTGETDCTICDCTTGTASSASWYADFTTRELYGKCGAATFFRKSFDMSSTIVITSLMTPSNGVSFRIPPSPVSPTGKLCLSSPEYPGYYYVLSIDESGNISDSGGVSATCS